MNIGVLAEEWNVFRRRWEVFRTGSAIDTASAAAQLFQCGGNELCDCLLKANPQIAESNLTDLLAEMRSLAVIPMVTGVARSELFQLCQEHDEPYSTFASRARRGRNLRIQREV